MKWVRTFFHTHSLNGNTMLIGLRNDGARFGAFGPPLDTAYKLRPTLDACLNLEYPYPDKAESARRFWNLDK